MILFIKIIIVVILLTVVSLIIRKKMHHKSNRIKVILVVLVVIISSFVLSFDVEYYTLFYDTPEEAFMHNHTNELIIDVFELEQCAYIISTEKPTHTKVSVSLIENADDGWRIEKSGSSKNYKRYIIENGSIYLYSKGLRGFVLIFQFIGPDNSEDIIWSITDSNDAVFKSRDIYSDATVSLRIYYSVIEKLEAEYSVYINGETLSLKK